MADCNSSVRMVTNCYKPYHTRFSRKSQGLGAKKTISGDFRACEIGKYDMLWFDRKRKQEHPWRDAPVFWTLLRPGCGNDGHRIVPRRPRACGDPKGFDLLGASKLPRHQGFAPLAQNAWRRVAPSPRWGRGLFHGHIKTGAPMKGAPVFQTLLRPGLR